MNDDRANWRTVRCTNCKELQRHPQNNSLFVFNCQSCQGGGFIEIVENLRDGSIKQKPSMATLDLHLLDKDNLIYLVQSLAAKWGGK